MPAVTEQPAPTRRLHRLWRARSLRRVSATSSMSRFIAHLRLLTIWRSIVLNANQSVTCQEFGRCFFVLFALFFSGSAGRFFRCFSIQRRSTHAIPRSRETFSEDESGPPGNSIPKGPSRLHVKNLPTSIGIASCMGAGEAPSTGQDGTSHWGAQSRRNDGESAKTGWLWAMTRQRFREIWETGGKAFREPIAAMGGYAVRGVWAARKAVTRRRISFR